MRQIITVMVLCLLVAPMALANDEKAPDAVKPVDQSAESGNEVVKMDAEEIFALVEQVLKNPKADRAVAVAFLQKVMAGQVTMTRLEVAINEGNTSCEAKTCRGKLCRKCNFDTGKCFCGNCCLAAAP